MKYILLFLFVINNAYCLTKDEIFQRVQNIHSLDLILADEGLEVEDTYAYKLEIVKNKDEVRLAELEAKEAIMRVETDKIRKKRNKDELLKVKAQRFLSNVKLDEYNAKKEQIIHALWILAK